MSDSRELTREFLTQKALEKMREEKYKPTKEYTSLLIRCDVFEYLMTEHNLNASGVGTNEGLLLYTAVQSAWETYMQEIVEHKEDN